MFRLVASFRTYQNRPTQINRLNQTVIACGNTHSVNERINQWINEWVGVSIEKRKIVFSINVLPAPRDQKLKRAQIQSQEAYFTGIVTQSVVFQIFNSVN